MSTTFTSGTTIKSAEVNANFLEKKARTYSTTATAAGTTTLTVSSNQLQFFTGTTTQTVALPVASTMSLGYGFEIFNLSTGIVTVNSSGANLVQSMATGSKLEVICILASGTSAASWQVIYMPNFAVGTNPMTTAGDVIIAGASGTPTRLAGAVGVLQGAVGSGPSYTQAPTLTTPTMTAPVVSTLLDLTAGQIKFPATQSASADANTLDDYEEGTWTPSISGFTVGNGSVTGTYTKIGRMVSVNMQMIFGTTSSITTITGVTGLPFTSANYSVAPIFIYDTGAGFHPMMSGVSGGGTSLTYPVGPSSAVITATTPMTWANTDVLNISITYSV